MKTIDVLEGRVRRLEDKLFQAQRLLADQIHCGVKTGHLFSPVKIYPSSVIFKCVKCALEYQKNNEDLTTREKRVLTTIREEKK